MSKILPFSAKDSKYGETTIIVVDFKNKHPVAVFRNESDENVLCFLHKIGIPPKKLSPAKVISGDNVLDFSRVA